jgi:hypothetical protein
MKQVFIKIGDFIFNNVMVMSHDRIGMIVTGIVVAFVIAVIA